MIDKDYLKTKFKEVFSKEPNWYFFSPGRVNFIGEHIDYNGGKVFPFAIDKGIYAAVWLSDSSLIQLYSEIDKKVYKFSLEEDLSIYKNHPGWIKYPIGVIQAIKGQGYFFNGFSVYFASDLPIGSGLSSSAAIEVLMGYIVYSLVKADYQIDRTQLAILCQQVENQYVGVKCGIMDQFTVAMGKQDHLILLDTHSLEYEYIPFEFPDVELVVVDSKKPRELTSSKYNERRTECHISYEILNKLYKIKNLVDADLSHLESLHSDTLIRRTRHVITENQRVKETKELLINHSKQKRDPEKTLNKLGKLLVESHYSLKNDYEVSCRELDIIVEESMKIDGVYGVRMTGAGFGGSAIALVKKDYFDEYRNKIMKVYKNLTNFNLEVFSVKISDGIKRL
ncbi:MAG: galactokinase [Leptospiraceae bacterium]|nr:galactokinase [Leptospiraceae bacterium]MDW7976528.1 galactokinase [Leptospiraceae bacterium]